MDDKKITYLETFVRYNHVYFPYEKKKKKTPSYNGSLRLH